MYLNPSSHTRYEKLNIVRFHVSQVDVPAFPSLVRYETLVLFVLISLLKTKVNEFSYLYTQLLLFQILKLQKSYFCSFGKQFY